MFRGETLARKASSKERRKWERLPLAVPMFVRGRDQRGHEFLEFGTALNVSAGGVLLAVGRHVPVPSRVSLEVPCAPETKPAGLPRTVRRLFARLVHRGASVNSQLLGLKFSKPLLTRKVRKNSSSV